LAAFGRKLSDPRKADIALLLMTLIWGASFPAVKIALLDASPFVFLSLRFSIASAVLLCLIRTRLSCVERSLVVPGLLLGASFFLGFAFQTVGLGITTASRSAFITGLSVVFVPFLGLRLEGKRVGRYAFFGVALALGGLWFITSPGGRGSFNLGDLLTLFCALAFALQIVLVQIYSKRHDYLKLMLFQFLVTVVLSVPSMILLESPRLVLSSRLVLAAAFTAIVATVVAIGIQFRYQRLTTATRAAIIYTLEPVFAAGFAFLVLGELMRGRAWVGAGMILFAIAVSEKAGRYDATRKREAREPLLR